MKKILFLATLVATLFVTACTPKVDESIKVLIVTGHTDKWHNWKTMYPFLEELMAKYDRFESETLIMPQEGEFNPDFFAYDAVIVNVNEVEWSDQTKENFENYVLQGGGVVIIHEADNAFPNWVAYNRIIGIGGWGERDASNGPYYYYKDGEYVRDYTSAGEAGKHGKPVPFQINVRDSVHPILKGLPTKWMHYDDELYSNMRGPAEEMHVLATAYSDSVTGGSGKEEPVLFTIGYGKGRVFHTVLGHTRGDYMKALANKGFQVTLSRGIEWAATGDVKQPLDTDF